jgi:hypothetical protein
MNNQTNETQSGAPSDAVASASSGAAGGSGAAASTEAFIEAAEILAIVRDEPSQLKKMARVAAALDQFAAQRNVATAVALEATERQRHALLVLLQESLDLSNLSSYAYHQKYPHARGTRKDLNQRIGAAVAAITETNISEGNDNVQNS